ncbi:MAG: hypothetical protein ABGX16_20935 [Pirellulales bacterium]
MRVHTQTLGTLLCMVLSTTCWLSHKAFVRAEFDLIFSYQDSNHFSSAQLQILDDALAQTEIMWETVITGYQPGISVTTVPIKVHRVFGGLASANHTGTVLQGGYRVATSGFININVHEIDRFASGVDPGGNFNTGLNYIDELLAHETGHVLGIGTLWTLNGVYSNTSWTKFEPLGKYSGQYGLQTYQQEFDQHASYVPVELAGSTGTANSHWDQIMRSSTQEGDPDAPWPRTPLVGVTDSLGRDRGLELMTGAIDPDFSEPFISLTTIESMRDMGFTVTVPEDFNGDSQVDDIDLGIWQSGFGSSGLQIDSIIYGDSQRDRDIDGADFLTWQRNLSFSNGATVTVPEPASLGLLVSVFLIVVGYARPKQTA